MRINSTRRRFLQLATGGTIGLGLNIRPIQAQSTQPRLWRSPPDCYFAYPHSSGFLPNGRLLITQIKDARTIRLLSWDFQSGDVTPLTETSRSDVYADVAEATGEIFFVHDRRAIMMLPFRGGAPQKIHDLPSDGRSKAEALLSVVPDGSRILFAMESFAPAAKTVDAASIQELDRRSGEVSGVCAMPFNADHQQYCPADPNWIGFAHEGDIRHSLDRVWGLNRPLRQPPSPLWNERGADGAPLLVGHERWAFHRPGAMVVAYAGSPSHQTGLYFVDPVSRTARLLSPSDHDWHCNVSRTGRWAVVDTKPSREISETADEHAVCDIVLIDTQTGRRRVLAQAHAKDHPWHPHPHFTPDGRHVVFNDYEGESPGSRSATIVVETGVTG